jgi:hypothetical protein
MHCNRTALLQSLDHLIIPAGSPCRHRMCCSGVIGVASKRCKWCSTLCTVAVPRQRACTACLLLAAAVQCVAAVASSKCLVRLCCTGGHQAQAGLLPTARPVHLKGSVDDEHQHQQQQQQQQQGVSSPRSAMEVCQSPPSAVRARLDLHCIRFTHLVQRTQLLSSQAEASPCEAAGVSVPGSVRKVSHSPASASSPARPTSSWYHQGSPFSLQKGQAHNKQTNN